jgi:beta-phosphoglucomutase-like phosphatase (HAD superfamily)
LIAALFDFDGTLADTDLVHRACWNEVLRPHSVSFEDTESGVKAAKSAGMLSFAIPNEYTRSHCFHMSDHLCKDMSEAKNIISKIT